MVRYAGHGGGSGVAVGSVQAKQAGAGLRDREATGGAVGGKVKVWERLARSGARGTSKINRRGEARWGMGCKDGGESREGRGGRAARRLPRYDAGGGRRGSVCSLHERQNAEQTGGEVQIDEAREHTDVEEKGGRADGGLEAGRKEDASRLRARG